MIGTDKNLTIVHSEEEEMYGLYVDGEFQGWLLYDYKSPHMMDNALRALGFTVKWETLDDEAEIGFGDDDLSPPWPASLNDVKLWQL